MSTKKLNTKIFIERAAEINNNYYNYDKTIYINSRTHLIVTCTKHGDFSIRPDTHLCKKPRGCKLCSNNVIDKIEFIEKSNKIHNNKYDYTLSDYKGKKKKVKIICPKHGVFEQMSEKHLSAQGCPFCNRSEICGSKKMTTKQFIKNANKTHKNRYDYSKSNYVGSRKKIEVICKKHGSFMVGAHSHLKDSGCPKCGFNTSLAGDKWIESFNNDNIITEEVINISGKRFKVDGIDYKTNTVYEYFGSFWHGHPNRKDLKGNHPFLKIPYTELYQKTLDRVQYMKDNGFNVIYKWGR